MNMIELIMECKKHELLLTILTFIDITCIIASYFAIFFEFIFLPFSSLGCAIFTPLLILIPEFIILFLLISVQVISRREMVKIKEAD